MKIKKKNKSYVRETTRITYKKLVSQPILWGSDIVIVKINKDDKTFKIVDKASEKICYASGKGKSLDDAKKQARARLLLGAASIYDETRVRKRS